MTKKFTPLTIGKHEQNEKDYITSVEAKISHFKALFTYLAKYVETEDKDAFEGQIYNVFIQRFSDRHFANFPTLKIEKILELHDCQSHQVDALVKAFESIDVQWNFQTNLPKETPCFLIKTEFPEQNIRYQKANKLIAALDQIKDQRHLYLADIVRGLNGIVQYDFSTQKIVPSISFVLGLKERNTY